MIPNLVSVDFKKHTREVDHRCQSCFIEIPGGTEFIEVKYRITPHENANIYFYCNKCPLPVETLVRRQMGEIKREIDRITNRHKTELANYNIALEKLHKLDQAKGN